MSCKCKVCYEWRPKNVDGVGAKDEQAMCNYLGFETNRDAECEHGAIINPNKSVKVSAKPRTKVKKEKKKRAFDMHMEGNRTLPGSLYGHQLEAMEKFMNSNEIALFFEMGCGKSATALSIACLKYNVGEIKQLLIVAPNDVHRQWFDEQVPAWVPIEFESQIVGGRGGRGEMLGFDDETIFNILCVNIDTFSQPTKWKSIVDWARRRDTMIILDEATSIKNVESKRTQRLLYEFNNVIHSKNGKSVLSSEKVCKVRCVLTGTPVTNGPMDLWSIMEFVQPNFFGRNWYSFKQYYGMFTKVAVDNGGFAREISILVNDKTWAGIKRCKSYEEAYAIFGCTQDTYFTVQSQDRFIGPYKHADELKQKLLEVSMFKKLTECVDMPEQNYIIRTLEMSPEQEACYAAMKNDLYVQYAGHEMTAQNKLTVSTRLQQICSGFLCDKFFDYDSYAPDEENDFDISPDEVQWIGKSNPKLDALYRDVDELVKPLIILTKYSAEAARIYDDLSKNYNVCLFTGWKRIGTIDGFKNGDYDIMVANTKVISKGFNLQNSYNMIFYSNTYSMEDRQQAEHRTFRIGQKNNCNYIDYKFEDTVDEDIMDAIRRKKDMLEYFQEAE